MRKTFIFLISIFLFFGFVAPRAWANNLDVDNVSLADQDTANDTYDIEFDIAWDNSWYDTGAPSLTANWDAAWVFAKYSVYSAGTWSDWTHCKLSNADGDHSAPAGAQIDTGLNTAGTYGMGVFLYRSAAGTGSNDWNDAQIRWDYGADGVADDAVVKVKLFGVEMVYIPEGNFYVGDTDCSNEGNIEHSAGCAGAVQITDAPTAALCTDGNGYDEGIECADDGDDTGTFCIDGDGGFDLGCDGIENTDFPTGYNAFYMMKYELTQEQYVDFLNMLTRTQQNNRTASQTADQYVMSNSANVRYHNGIRAPASVGAGVITFGNDLDGIIADDTSNGDGTFGETDDGQNIAVNYVSWMDGTAYADWAGLRPFTELELEKAMRGGQIAVNDEYACGSSNGPDGAYTIDSFGMASENVSANYEDDPECNQVDSTSDGTNDGPLRVGIFADNDSTRKESGGSYFGVMELSGNLWERPVTIGNATGRAFTGTHGDGSLSTNGFATNSDWPGYDGDDVTGATGSGFRGGTWLYSSTYARVSARSYGAYTGTGRGLNVGFRCSRTSP